MFFKTKILNESDPIEIPRYLHKQIVKEIQKIQYKSDHWVDYKAVVRKRNDEPKAYDIRVFDEWEVTQHGFNVTDYASLSARKDLIRFEGWFDSQSKQAEIRLKTDTDNSA